MKPGEKVDYNLIATYTLKDDDMMEFTLRVMQVEGAKIKMKVFVFIWDNEQFCQILTITIKPLYLYKLVNPNSDIKH